MITEGELVYLCMLANLAVIECHFEGRPFCIFNHPEHPGARFEIGGFLPARGVSLEDLAMTRVLH